MSQTSSLAIRSISWRGIGAISQLVLGFLFTLILMRYISPDEYGVVAKVYIVLSVFSLLLDFGFSIGIIQSKEKSVEFLSSHFILSIGLAIFLAIVMCLVAPFIADFYEVPQLRLIFYALAGNLLIGGSVIVHRAFMHKKLMFKELSIINFIAFLISGIVALILAFYSYGYYAIVAQIISLNIIQAILLWFYSGFKPKMYFSKNDILKTTNFSIYIFFTQALNHISELLDQFLSSIYFSQEALGKYNRSISLTRTPVKLIPTTFSSVLLPLFSHSINEEGVDRNEHIYVRSSCLIFYLIAPLLLLIFIFPEQITETILPSDWWTITPYIKWLALVSVFMILEIENSLFLSKGKSREVSKIVFINRLIRIICICVGIQYGLMSLIYALLLAEIMMRLVYMFALKYYLNFDVLNYLNKLGVSIICVLIFVVILYLGKQFLEWSHVLFLITALIAYLIYLFIGYRFRIGSAGKDLGVLLTEIKK